MQKTRLLPYIGAYFGGESVDKSMKMTKTDAAGHESFSREILLETLFPLSAFSPYLALLTGSNLGLYLV